MGLALLDALPHLGKALHRIHRSDGERHHDARRPVADARREALVLLRAQVDGSESEELLHVAVALGAVPRAGRRRRRREQHVDHLAAELSLGRAERLEVELDAGEVT